MAVDVSQWQEEKCAFVLASCSFYLAKRCLKNVFGHLMPSKRDVAFGTYASPEMYEDDRLAMKVESWLFHGESGGTSFHLQIG